MKMVLSILYLLTDLKTCGNYKVQSLFYPVKGWLPSAGLKRERAISREDL